MPSNIQLLSASGDSVVFLINSKRYRYTGLDGLIVNYIRALAWKQPGKALALAKRKGELWG